MARVLSMSSALGVGLAYAGAASAQGVRTISFDIPAQPLSSALERYSAASGAQVVYDGTLAADHVSTPVEGLFTPANALERLLTGTELVPHYTAADNFFLTPETATPAAQNSEVNTASRVVVEQYYGHIQASLRRAFCAQDDMQSDGYRVAVSFWMNRFGEVSRAALLGSTGRSDLDAKINRTVESVSVDAPPPAGFAQPVVLIVTPALAQYCQAAQTGPEIGSAGQ